MKFRLTLVLAAVVVLGACKKKKQEDVVTPEEPAASYEMPTTVGSYWVYHWEDVDANGNTSPLSAIDTTLIVGDTLINNKQYIVFEGTFFGGQKQRWCERDSSGFIVNLNGTIVCAYNSSPMEFSQTTVVPYILRNGVSSPASVSLPVGNFENSVRMYTNVSNADGSALTACGSQSIDLYTYFVSGIGLIRREMAFFGQLQSNCIKKRSKLVAYFIAP